MKFTKLILATLAILGLTATAAQARHHPAYAKASSGRRHHGPRVKFGFGFNIATPYYAPVELRRASPVMYARPCCPCRPMVVAPVAYAPLIRPSFGVSFGTGPVSFGFGF